MADQLPKMPASFKAVLPFIRRAEELDRDSSRPESKLIAYFCRQYAMELGIKVRENDTSNEATEYLLALMDRLELDKSNLPTFTQEEGKEICEDFALEIFSKADDEDRAGAADKYARCHRFDSAFALTFVTYDRVFVGAMLRNTARTFYAAGTFFDILNQFGDISEAISEKRKYCKYKAAMILKAIKEGRAPTPGPPSNGMDGSEGGDDLASSTGMNFPSAPVAPPTPVAAPAPAPAPRPDPYVSAQQPPAYTPPPPQVASPPSAPRNDASEFPSFTLSAGSTGPSSSAPTAPVNTWNPPAAPVSAPLAPAPAPVHTPAPAPVHHQYATHTPSAPSLQPPPAAYAAPSSTPVRSRNGPVSQNEINDAIECAKFAIAALKIKDVELAAQRLEAALRSIR